MTTMTGRHRLTFFAFDMTEPFEKPGRAERAPDTGKKVRQRTMMKADPLASDGTGSGAACVIRKVIDGFC